MLTRMGRDIVRNNAALGHDEAVARVARHLRSFWTPAMIAEIESYAAANPGNWMPLSWPHWNNWNGSRGSNC